MKKNLKTERESVFVNLSYEIISVNNDKRTSNIRFHWKLERGIHGVYKDVFSNVNPGGLFKKKHFKLTFVNDLGNEIKSFNLAGFGSEWGWGKILVKNLSWDFKIGELTAILTAGYVSDHIVVEQYRGFNDNE